MLPNLHRLQIYPKYMGSVISIDVTPCSDNAERQILTKFHAMKTQQAENKKLQRQHKQGPGRLLDRPSLARSLVTHSLASGPPRVGWRVGWHQLRHYSAQCELDCVQHLSPRPTCRFVIS